VAAAAIYGTPDEPGTIAFLEKSLNDLDALPTRLRELERQRRRKTLEIFKEKRRLQAYYEGYYGAVQDFLQKHRLSAKGAFKVTFTVTMAQSGFGERFLSQINKRKLGAFAGVEDGALRLKELMDATDWNSARSVTRFCERLVAMLKHSAGVNREVHEQLLDSDGVQALYDSMFALDYLAPIYRLTWDGKGLEQLSPGERGNLLLIFYLLVDRDDIPLIIDQPEENLDNQTVVKTLVPCIQDAKRRRQIVIVTHNPNLAVVCDAEQVIYAEIRKEQDNEVTYVAGSIEDPTINRKILDVLEGTRPAFDQRDSRYLP
jgi:hypothetical protein